MLLCARHRNRALALLAASALAPPACGTNEGGNQPQTLDKDAGPGSGGLAGSGGSAGAGMGGGGDAGSSAGSAGSGATHDAAHEPEPCGKEFQSCCGGQRDACENSATLSCNDGACVACGSVPAPGPVCMNCAVWGMATASRTRPPDEAAPSYAPELAIDGNVCNVWASGDYAVNPDTGAAIETWWQVDLQNSRKIAAWTLWLAMTPPGTVSLRIEYGSDGRTWQTAWSGSQPMSGHAPWIHSLPKPIDARYLRVTFLDSPSWISIREFAAFECPGSQ